MVVRLYACSVFGRGSVVGLWDAGAYRIMLFPLLLGFLLVFWYLLRLGMPFDWSP